MGINRCGDDDVDGLVRRDSERTVKVLTEYYQSILYYVNTMKTINYILYFKKKKCFYKYL